MNERDDIEPDAAARIRQLEKELRFAQRSLRHLQRERERAELFALRSKQAILGTNRELQAANQGLERALEQLREAKVRAEQASEAKGRFVATISHELRTPMNGILGTVELISRADLPPAVQDLVAIVRKSGLGLLSIINDVLDFSKAESGRLALEQVRFDLHAGLRAINDLLLNAAREKGLVLELAVSPDVPRWVLGDPVRLRQVLLNLLDNAVKFTAAGTVRLEVATVEGSTRRLRFAVTDTGIGIPASALGAIFEPFVQADTSTNRRFGGSGLGLAICRHIVELMQGKIEVESTEGEGTRFSFEAELPPAADQSASLSHTNGFSVDAVRLGMHVLVVDDNAVNRLIADRMLQMLGCSTVVLESGREAIERAGRESFDVILMDCSMPEIDGFAATAAIRRLAAPHGAVRIIAMTALALPGDRERCLRAGMDGYVTKPMQLRRLQQALCTRTDGAIEASGAEVGEPGSP